MKLEKKDLLLLVNKLIEKIPVTRNDKQHDQSFIRKKSTKSLKKTKIITHQPKDFQSPNMVDVKSVT